MLYRHLHLVPRRRQVAVLHVTPGQGEDPWHGENPVMRAVTTAWIMIVIRIKIRIRIRIRIRIDIGVGVSMKIRIRIVIRYMILTRI